MVSQQRFLSWPFFLALAGILFSLWNVLGNASALCVTEGCSLFTNYTLAGVSLWWVGVAGFGLLLLLAIPGLAGLGAVCAGLGVALDCLLLLIMLFTAPCFNCLIVGLLLVLTFVAYRAAARREQRRHDAAFLSPLLAVWVLLFVVDAGCLIHGSLGSWALAEPADGAEPSVRVYFSPSCVACVSLVRAYDADRSGAAAWYPVAENDHDLLIIADMRRRLGGEGTEGVGDGAVSLAAALDAALADVPARFSSLTLVQPDYLWLRFRLWRNAAHVLDAGSGRLPFVEFHGVPAILTAPPAATPSASSPAPSGGTAPLSAMPAPATPSLPFLDVTGFCNGGDEPCAEAAAPSSLDSLMHGDRAE